MIKLKIKHSRLPFVANSLLNYSDFCSVKIEKATFLKKENWAIRISISIELFHIINAQYSKRYPSELYSLKMELHQALVLQGALIHDLMSTEGNIFKKNAIEQIKNELNQLIVANSFGNF